MDLEAETLHLFHVLNQEAADEVALRREAIVQVLCLVVWQSWPKSNTCPPQNAPNLPALDSPLLFLMKKGSNC